MVQSLTVYHYFPNKLNLYGDRGNVIALAKRAEWRGIVVDVVPVEDVRSHTLSRADLFFIGGGSDREQSLCTEQLMYIKDDLKAAINDGMPALTICGGYQFLGSYYQDVNGNKLKTLNLLDFYTEAKNKRLIGNVVVKSKEFGTVVGFENHGGQTYHSYDVLGNVKIGYGNNDEEATEGLRYKHLIGTYLHGPLLPKNPVITDYLLAKAMERKYGVADLQPLDTRLENEANRSVERGVR